MPRYEYPLIADHMIGLRTGTLLNMTLDDIWHFRPLLQQIWMDAKIKWTPEVRPNLEGQQVYTRRIVVEEPGLDAWRHNGAFTQLIAKHDLSTVFKPHEIYGDTAKDLLVSLS